MTMDRSGTGSGGGGSSETAWSGDVDASSTTTAAAAAAATTTTTGTTTTTTTTTPTLKRNSSSGVADYFAVLGVGEHLVWKHTQKSCFDGGVGGGGAGSSSSSSSSSSAAAAAAHETTEHEAENESSMMERFHREIVDVTIFCFNEETKNLITPDLSFPDETSAASSTTTTTTSGNHSTSHQPSISQPLSQSSSSATLKPPEQPHQPHHPHHPQHHHHHEASTPTMTNSQQKYPIPVQATLTSSPSRSDTSVTIQESASADHNHHHQQQQQLNQQQPQHGPKHDSRQHQQRQHLILPPTEFEGFVAIQQTCPAGRSQIHETSSGPAGEIWSQSQVFDANLDPLYGFRRQLLDRLTLLSEQDAQQKREGVGGSGEALRGLGRKVGSTLRNQFIPIINNHMDRFRDRRFAETPSNSYYLGYRRRTHDEKDRPAIAELALHYVRIHRATLCPRSPMSTPVPGEKTAAAAAATETASSHGSNSSTATTGRMVVPGALKRSLQTGAVLAARVAEAGKQRLVDKYRATTNNATATAAAAVAAAAAAAATATSTTSTTTTSTSTTTTEDKMSNDDPTHKKNLRFLPDKDAAAATATAGDVEDSTEALFVPLDQLIAVPNGFDEWSIAKEYKWIRFPKAKDQLPSSFRERPNARRGGLSVQSRIRRTFVFPHHTGSIDASQSDDNGTQSSEPSGAGMEAFAEVLPSPPSSAAGATDVRWSPRSSPNFLSSDASVQSPKCDHFDPDELLPRLLPELPAPVNEMVQHDDVIFIPVLAIRRQRVADDERYHEDPAITDLAVSFDDGDNSPVLPDLQDSEGDEDDDDEEFSVLNKTNWAPSTRAGTPTGSTPRRAMTLGSPIILAKHNIPLGFADAAFATQVLDRFPVKNYKGFPLPEEELPMFCYPTGCRLKRASLCEAPLPQFYGFVVKNERGDSIHVSCVSFMEPLTSSKVEQLSSMSHQRRRVSLPHRRFCQRQERQSYDSTPRQKDLNFDATSQVSSTTGDDVNHLLTGFDEIVTFENKTICLVSRFPFWTAFRRFLSHLHILTGSSSGIPLERWISHLLLSVPLPRPGGPVIVVPLPALNSPMLLSAPPSKDLHLVDLPFDRLLACLDVPTIVTVVLGFLALERKLIIMSSRPSLVLDICELLKSLLFPFELCAPYVPRLTQPFMSCLDFPGAIFVGIHDDGLSDGLASIVRTNMPEDSVIVDLDTGEIDCSGDRYQVLKQSWGIIPSGPRSMLVSEIETLCRDAGIVPGQEPLDSQIDSAFDASIPAALVEDMNETTTHMNREPLDDRAVRDSFLRFFCSILGGYERFLVVPDVDFMTSGNEWFDSQGFLGTASSDRSAFLGALVTTQLFQSFVQRRTESSDIRCLLFDECLAEYHSSPVPYGRLGGDVETVTPANDTQQQMMYSLLVDQCSTISYQSSWDHSDVDDEHQDSQVSSSDHGQGSTAETFLSKSGDVVSLPSRVGLPKGSRFSYCMDGHPCFPHKLATHYFLPKEQNTLLVEPSDNRVPFLLARSEGEIEDAYRRRQMATSHSRLRSQRRCLWQLPKLMGSHFLGAWLMCIPSLVSQPGISDDIQARYILRALGALRLLRSRQRIIPDEASYRAMMVACGRSRTDRRAELVKLFGMLRSDGIFPSAVTLGQYTRALAEGYSKRSKGLSDDGVNGGVEVSVATDKENAGRRQAPIVGAESLMALDGDLAVLEDSGRRWRSKHGQRDEANAANHPSSGHTTHHSTKSERSKKKSSARPWLPVFSSSSIQAVENAAGSAFESQPQVTLVALWSRTAWCSSCSYVPLDEEIQSGWDVPTRDADVPGEVACPRCGNFLIPRLGFEEMELNEAALREKRPPQSGESLLPPQLRPIIQPAFSESSSTPRRGYVTYQNPATVRASLERFLSESGEQILDRDTLKQRDRELYYNLWWYCARFSLPLPLPVRGNRDGEGSLDCAPHSYAFAAWDHSVAEHGCVTAANAILALCGQEKNMNSEDGEASTISQQRGSEIADPSLAFHRMPLLARFNLQGYSQSDWDHPELSQILVSLVEACDKRDFKPVLESSLACGAAKGQPLRSAGSHDNSSKSFEVMTLQTASTSSAAGPAFDMYRTILYLAKYQCTSAFHVFFPATAKACKGYHFWCAFGTPLPMFDRLFRDASKRVQEKYSFSFPICDVSDTALGFRCVFGHVI